MEGRRSLLELGTGGMRKEGVFLTLPAQNRGRTSDRSPLVGCIGFAKFWEILVFVQLLGSSCTAGRSPALAAGVRRASEAVMRKTIQRVSRDLQDVS